MTRITEKDIFNAFDIILQNATEITAENIVKLGDEAEIFVKKFAHDAPDGGLKRLAFGLYWQLNSIVGQNIDLVLTEYRKK